MPRKLPSRRRIAIYVAVLFLAVAGICFLSLRMNSVYFWHHLRFNCLAALSVDFSVPGTYTASIHHRPPIFNYPILGLDVPRKVLAETSPGELVAGLRGTYSIRDAADGVKIFWGSLVEDPNEVSAGEFPDIILLHRFHEWYDEAKWQIDVIVTEGAPRLKGVRQRLVLVGNGSSLSPVTVLMWVALVVAAIILVVVVAGRFRGKKSPKEDKQPADADGT
jgi:hypothetical protein